VGSLLFVSLFVGAAVAVLASRAVLDPFSRDEPTEPPAIGLRPREAAKALSISPRTLATWTKAGIVPHTKIGKVVLYSAADLQAWLAERANAQQSAK
jgi:excisionase family DNA binding protein